MRWGVTARSPTMVTLHDTGFVECRRWNDSWTVTTIVTWRSLASMIPAPDIFSASEIRPLVKKQVSVSRPLKQGFTFKSSQNLWLWCASKLKSGVCTSTPESSLPPESSYFLWPLLSFSILLSHNVIFPIPFWSSNWSFALHLPLGASNSPSIVSLLWCVQPMTIHKNIKENDKHWRNFSCLL